MKVDRKIAMVATQVKMEDEDKLDVAFWLSRTPSERLSEVSRLRQNYFNWLDGKFPQKIEKVVHHRKA
jgi:hypothetical protein